MPDPVAPPTPVEAAAALQAARQVGGLAFRTEATRLQEAGAQLSSADRQLLTNMNASRGSGAPAAPVAEAMFHGGLSPADARSDVIGNRLLAAGRSLAEARETIGDPSFKGDDRSPAQVAHDQQHGMAPKVNPASYFAPIPGAGRELSAPDRALDAEARGLASGLGLSPAAGSNFIKTVYAAASEMANSADRGMLRQKWEQQLAAVFRDGPGDKPGSKLAEATRQVENLLKGIDAPLVKRLRDAGLLRNPTILTALRNRALSVNAWLASRPK
jgi:hypothetical protein